MKTIRTKIKITVNETKQVRRPGAGRTKGSFSFVKISMAELNRYVNEAACVTVSRKWCEEVGIVTGICTYAQLVHRTRI